MALSSATRFGPDKDAGFALAAVLADDRGLKHVAGQLAADDLARIRALAASRGEDRSQLLARLLAALQPRLTELAPTLPARLCALLAPQLPRSAAQQALADAPLSRAGFEPERELMPRLLRIARFGNASYVRETARPHADGST